MHSTVLSEPRPSAVCPHSTASAEMPLQAGRAHSGLARRGHLERAFDASSMASSPASVPGDDPDAHGLIAPPQAPDVDLRYAPYKLRNADWDSQRDALGAWLSTRWRNMHRPSARSKRAGSSRPKTWSRPTASPRTHLPRRTGADNYSPCGPVGLGSTAPRCGPVFMRPGAHPKWLDGDWRQRCARLLKTSISSSNATRSHLSETRPTKRVPVERPAIS